MRGVVGTTNAREGPAAAAGVMLRQKKALVAVTLTITHITIIMNRPELYSYVGFRR